MPTHLPASSDVRTPQCDRVGHPRADLRRDHPFHPLQRTQEVQHSLHDGPPGASTVLSLLSGGTTDDVHNEQIARTRQHQLLQPARVVGVGGGA